MEKSEYDDKLKRRTYEKGDAETNGDKSMSQDDEKCEEPRGPFSFLKRVFNNFMTNMFRGAEDFAKPFSLHLKE